MPDSDEIAKTLKRLSDELNRAAQEIEDAPRALALIEVAQEHLRERKLRDDVFGQIFGEPGWDILLDLFLSQERDRRVTVSDVCVATRVPATTALRWLHLLEQSGLVSRARDQRDGRRIFVSLSEKGRALMLDWVGRVGRATSPQPR